MTRIGTKNQLTPDGDESWGQSAFAKLLVHDVNTGDEWRLPVEAFDVTYTDGEVPQAIIRLPIGQRVATLQEEAGGVMKFAERVTDNGTLTTWSQTFPRNSGFYELKVLVDLNGVGGYEACLFRGYLLQIKVLDARETPSGRKAVKLIGLGSQGFLKEAIIGGGISNQSMSAGPLIYAQNSSGEFHAQLTNEVGDGSKSIPNLIRDALTYACKQNLDVSGVGHSASKAGWVLQNLLQTDNWYIDMSPGWGAYAVGEIMLSLLTRSGSDLWTVLQGLAAYMNLSIISGVNKLIVAPTVRPYHDHDLTLDRGEIKSIAVEPVNKKKVRGIQLVQNTKTITNDADSSRQYVPRVLAYMYYQGASGAIERISAERWPWLMEVDDPEQRAYDLCRQMVLDKVFGTTLLHVNVPYVDDILPGSVVKVLDVEAFDETGSTQFGTNDYHQVDVYGTVHSVRIHMDSETPELETRITLSHVMAEAVYDDIALGGNDHMLADQVIHDVHADYQSWDVPDFSPNGSESEYPETNLWTGDDNWDLWPW